MGIVYAKTTAYGSSQKLAQDGTRCRVLEHISKRPVYAVDIGQAADTADSGRYICDSSTEGGLLSQMDELWPGMVFRHVIMDYSTTPTPWDDDERGATLYRDILPTMVNN